VSAALAGFFRSGHAVDLVLAVIALEFLALNLRRSPSRATWLDRALALMPGVCILLALRAALTGAPWPWVAAALAASFPFHVADVLRRRL
jgi:hypothetical protein